MKRKYRWNEGDLLNVIEIINILRRIPDKDVSLFSCAIKQNKKMLKEFVVTLIYIIIGDKNTVKANKKSNRKSDNNINNFVIQTFCRISEPELL